MPDPSHIFNNSLETGIIPEDWKSTIVNAIHKKRSRQEPGNNKPTCLTPVFCKTMERLVKRRLITHLEMDSQHGFRNQSSCLTCLLDFLAQVIDTYDTDYNKAVDLVFLDFQKQLTRYHTNGKMVKVNAMLKINGKSQCTGHSR